MRTNASEETSVQRLPLFMLLGANVISLVGSAITTIALPWFVLQTTGSAAMTGLTGFFVVLPTFIAGIFGGALVDRVGYKRVSVAEDIVSCLAIASIPLLHATIGLAFWQLLALVFVGALLAVPGISARRALLPQLAERAGMRLERANAAFEANTYLASLLGPALGGVLIVWLGVHNVLWLDAGSFVVSATMLAFGIPALQMPHQRRNSTGYFAEIAAGLRFLRQDRLLWALVVGLGVANFFGLSRLFAVVLPVFVNDTWGTATTLGLLISGQAAGALLGAFVFGAVGHHLPRRVVWIVGFLVGPLRLWMLTLSPELPLLLSILMLAGIVSGLFNPLLSTLRHERTPPYLHGRVFGTFAAIASVASPLGIIVAGYLIERFGLAPTLLVLAVGSSLVGLWMVTLPALADVETKG